MKDGVLKIIEGGDPVRAQAAAWFAHMRADDVSEGDRQRWRAWMDSDDRHRSAYARFERLWSEFGEFAPAPELARRLPPARARDDGPGNGRRALRWLAGAAAVALVAVGGWRLAAPVPAHESIYASAVGERRSIALEDGTRVDLDTDSQVRVRYTRGERGIALERGRAFFRVARDPQRPLTVETPDGGVRAIGTQFEVYRRDHAIEVALFEGKVQLLSAGRDGEPRTALAMLAPGQRARFGAHGERPRIDAFSAGDAPTWISGRLVFEDIPLAAALAEFNRYSRRRLISADASLAAMPVSGVFRSDDPEGFVEALRTVYGVSVRATASGDVVLANDP